MQQWPSSANISGGSAGQRLPVVLHQNVRPYSGLCCWPTTERDADSRCPTGETAVFARCSLEWEEEEVVDHDEQQKEADQEERGRRSKRRKRQQTADRQTGSRQQMTDSRQQTADNR